MNDDGEYDVDGLEAETEKAWLLIIYGEKFWLPKSQCQFDEGSMKVIIPNWLAKNHDLLD